MRRFASVFVTKRDKQDTQKSKQRSQTLSLPILPSLPGSNKKPSKSSLNISVPPPPPAPPPSLHPRSPASTPSTPQLSLSGYPVHSSASSSGSASLSLKTPDDNHHVTLERSSTKRSWKSWIGVKRSGSLKRNEQKKPTKDWDHPVPPWSPPTDPPYLRPPPIPNATPFKNHDTDEDTSSESEDDESDLVSELIPANTANSDFVIASPMRAQQNFQILIKNSLVPPLVSSPFIHSPGPIFPRSCNRSRLLPPPRTLITTMFRSHLLSRINDSSFNEDPSILPMGRRSTPAVIPSPTLSPFNEPYPSKSTKILASSPGIRRWIERPCFEDRFIIYVSTEEGLARQPVASDLAVAALEFSEAIDVMVIPDFDEDTLQKEKSSYMPWSVEPDVVVVTPPLAPAVPTKEMPQPQSTVQQPRGTTYAATPSPLRNQHSPSVAPTSTSAPSVKSDNVTVRAPPTVPATTVKRIVRFVEDDDDDGVPLHVVRMKKKREEKANFLRREQLKRIQEEAAEVRQREIEMVERERRQMAQEKERKELERRTYAEEVAASRLRRDFQRAGASLTNVKLNMLLPSDSSISVREPERNRPHDSRRDSSRQMYDSSGLPRREFSESPAPMPQYDSLAPSSYSPGSSPNFHSRPPSFHSSHHSSSEDIRHSGGSRRSSFVATPGMVQRPYPEQQSYFPMWGTSNQSVHVLPPIPPVPALFMHDMPLLPPSAPFMMQSTRKSRGPSPGPPSSSRSRGSASSSTERVNQQSHLRHRDSSSSARHDYQQRSQSPSLSPYHPNQTPTHERRASGESRRSGVQMWPQDQGRMQPATPSSSHPHTLSRGRSSQAVLAQSQQVPPPNPWTALPSQSGNLPKAMPSSMYSHTNLKAASASKEYQGSKSRRQTTIS